MEDAANSFEFFLPSPELAEALVEQNQALVNDYAKRTTPEADTQEETEDRSLLGGLVSGLRPKRIRESQTRSTETARRVIAERLYHYISSLSETPFALAGGEFPVEEYIADGMGTMLGLSSYRKEPDSTRSKEIRQLLERLTGEFQDWLIDEQNGKFVTPWLEMHLDARGQLRLILIAEDETDDSLEDQVEFVHSSSAIAGTSEHMPTASESEQGRGWDVVLSPVPSKYDVVQYSTDATRKELTLGIERTQARRRRYQKVKHDSVVSDEGRIRTEEKAN